VKCIIDFRIAFYDKIGKDSSEHREAAIKLHRQLDRWTIIQLNNVLDVWSSKFKDSEFLVRSLTVKGYVNHYRRIQTKISMRKTIAKATNEQQLVTQF